MQTPIERIERVITSHWHSDHTGGLLSFLELRRSVSEGNAHESQTPCIVDVHPDRPVARGIAPGPTFNKVICALPPDPTFEMIEEAGGVLEKHSEGHAVVGGTVWVSGEIPRVTEYEVGILGGMRWVQETPDEAGKWVNEQVKIISIPRPDSIADQYMHSCSISWTRDMLLSMWRAKAWCYSARER
jgi:7,8-dihydropterin-6-yl-methyl-4-(beta-D-ribofuranosyl)aminobenzene 5'-phosphate synthase